MSDLSKGLNMVKFKVEYTGEWPNACRGDLVIYKDDIEVFRTKSSSFKSTGSCGFLNDHGDSYINKGSLEFRYDEEKKRLFDFCMSQKCGNELYELCLKLLNDFDECCCGGCL